MPPEPRGERARLRWAVLHYGGLLGWSSRQVITFAEALTSRPWHECGTPECLAVLDEYLAILQVVQVKRERAVAREEVSYASGD